MTQDNSQPPDQNAIALIGMACRFPEANDYHTFWTNLAAGKNSIREFPPDRLDVEKLYSPKFDEPNKSVSKWCGLIDHIDRFDHRFFNISPREARNMDPQQRLLLEESWHCIEDSGIPDAVLKKKTTAVFVGVMAGDYLNESVNAVDTDAFAALGTYDCILANRISHFFGFCGPSLSISAACASSLVALHNAKASLLNGECDFALAAGVNLSFHPWKNIAFSKSRMLSPDGQCKTFDKDANGYVPGEGVAVVLLQRLADAQHHGNFVHALLRGSAVNHCGQSLSITAPRLKAQRDVILAAYKDAVLSPNTVTYTEAHGTGTSLGDPIEVDALNQAFANATSDRHFCHIGSVKTNIGHLEAAAGLAGLIKVVMMMRHRSLVPSLNLKALNPIIRFEYSPFQVIQDRRPWLPRAPDLPLRAGLSSFGFGGVNAHVVLQQAPSRSSSSADGALGNLFLLSARAPRDLDALLLRWRSFSLSPNFRDIPLHDLCATLKCGRNSFAFRLGSYVRAHEDIVSLLKAPGQPQFCQADQHWCVRFGHSIWGQTLKVLPMLNREPIFIRNLNRCLSVLNELDAVPASLSILPPDLACGKLLYSFLLDFAYARTLLDSGFVPHLLTGEKKGLLLALALAGMLDLKSSIALLLPGHLPRELILKRPKIPFYDPVSRATWPPFLFSVGYLRELISALDVVDKDLAVQLMHAKSLLCNQFTFKSLMDRWDAFLIQAGSSLELLFACQLTIDGIDDNARRRVLLFCVINHGLHALDQRWDLTPRVHVQDARLLELLELLLSDVLSPQLIIHLLLDPNPDFEHVASCLTARQVDLPDDSLLPLLLSHNCSLVEAGDPMLWLRDALALVPAVPALDNFFFLEFGQLSHPAPDPLRVDGALPVGDRNVFKSTLLQLWLRGVEIHWPSVLPKRIHHKYPLPTYPFAGDSFWLPGKPGPSPSDSEPSAPLVLPDSFLFLPCWQPLPLVDLMPCPKADAECWLIHSGHIPLLAKVFQRRLPHIKVLTLPDPNPDSNTLDASFFADLRDATVLFFVVAAPPCADTSLPHDLGPAAGHALLLLLQLLHQANPTLRRVLKLATAANHLIDGNESIAVQSCEVTGLARCLAREFSALKLSVLDLDAGHLLDESKLSASVDALIAEPAHKPCQAVALRDGRRFGRLLVKADLPRPDREVVTPGDHYLIAGGMGKVGLVLARYLLQCSAKITLLGRSQADPDLLASLTTSGQCLYLLADITVPESLNAALTLARKSHGPFKGVFHSAMVLARHGLMEMDLSSLRRVSAPKVAGSQVLLKAVADDPLDFFLFFSSIQSLTGFPGFGHYAAANVFADTLACRANQLLPFPVKIIHWGFWNLNLADPSNAVHAKDELAILPSHGLEAIRRLLASDLQSLAAFRLDDDLLPLLGVAKQTDSLYHFQLSQPQALLRFLHASDLLESLALLLLLKVWRAQGVFQVRNEQWSVAELRERLGFHGYLLRLFPSILALLIKAGFLLQSKDDLLIPTALLFQPECLRRLENLDAEVRQLAVDFPEAAGPLALLRAGFDRFSEITSGRVPATDVLFPAGSSELVSGFYKGNPTADQLNRWSASVVRDHVKRIQQPRILEIGAGTGGTSEVVLPLLADLIGSLEFVYSDISKRFTRHGRHHFGHFPFLKTQILDITRHPESQGFAPASFDVILAANVLHATPDIHSCLSHVNWLLKPGGLLVLNELTEARAFTQLSFGLLPGWWLYQDEAKRVPHAPLLSVAQWQQALSACHFGSIASSEQMRVEGRTLPQHVITAVATGPAEPQRVVQSTRMDTLMNLLAKTLDEPVANFDHDSSFMELGLDSILATEMIDHLNKVLNLSLKSTDPFNYPTPAALLSHMDETVPLQQAPAPVSMPTRSEPEAIAVIGMSARFPGASNLADFWENLSEGRSSISEIPPDRWPLAGFYSPDESLSNHSYSKWGGFLSDIDHFDPLFFNLSPAEAERMDPQQRLFLQEAWRALEDAGYAPDLVDGIDCSLFVGVEEGDYSSGFEGYDAFSLTGQSSAILSARLSYMLNLRGPSIPINTGCSSALVAAHLACETLRSGQSSMALLGGVALMTTPRYHIALSKTGMLSKDGHCYTFDRRANGFVPGEAVGALLLKTQAAAQRDGDRILGLIIGWGINQDGKSNGITAPNALSQAELIARVYARFEIQPKTIGYVEAHGTGTALGDPIEIQALTDAWSRFQARAEPCPIGSVKTNIGHTLASAGISGLVKVLLSLQHRKLVPSLNYSEENPHIGASPFYVNTQLKPWSKHEETPRRAALSSFGFSGVNAHLVLQEAPDSRPVEQARPTSQLILLSAKTESALKRMKRELQDWLALHAPADLNAVSYTLIRGRAPFTIRYAVVSDDVPHLSEQLNKDLPQQTRMPATVSAHLTRTLYRDLAAGIGERRSHLEALATLFMSGAHIDAAELFSRKTCLAMPTYPFAAESCWLEPNVKRKREHVASHASHPLLGENTSTLAGMQFTTVLDPHHFFLRDHRIGKHHLLPAVASLEMARLAAKKLAWRGLQTFRDLSWTAPIRVKTATRVTIDLKQAGKHLRYEIKQDDQIKSQGLLVRGTAVQPEPLRLDEIKQRCSQKLAVRSHYAALAETGYLFGPSFQGLQALQVGEQEALGEVTLDIEQDSIYQLHPGLADSCLQTLTALLPQGQLAMPVALDSMTLLAPLTGRLYSHARAQLRAGPLYRFDLSISDPTGKVLAYFHNYCLKSEDAEKREETRLIHSFRPQWLEQAAAPVAAIDSDVLLLSLFEKDRGLADGIFALPDGELQRLDDDTYTYDHNDPGALLQMLEADGHRIRHVIYAGWLNRPDDGTREEPFPAASKCAQLCAALMRHSSRQPMRLMYCYREPAMMLDACAAMFKTASREAPNFYGKTVRLDDVDARPALLAEWSLSDGHSVRYINGRRRVLTWMPSPLDPPKEPPFRRGATYVLSGGLGGIGRLISRHLASHYGANLILLGRSSPDESFLQELARQGSSTQYIVTDLTDEQAVRQALEQGRARFGAITGILHGAGVQRDNLLTDYSHEDLDAVLDPKVRGFDYLDQASALDELDFFIVHSSVSAVTGNPGQALYAYANSLMDGHIAQRQQRVKDGQRKGHSLSVNWPYWTEGGMHANAETQRWWREHLGMTPMSSEIGLSTLEATLATGSGQWFVSPGHGASLQAATEVQLNQPKRAVIHADEGIPRQGALETVTRILAEALKLEAAKLEPHEPLETYGIDSVMILSLNRALESHYGRLPKTLLFEYQTLAELAEYFASHQAVAQPEESIIATPAQSKEPVPVPISQPPARPHKPQNRAIAIIGIDGRYPMAADLDALWENLKQGLDCISEIPADRWDKELPLVSDQSSRWGGFLEEVAHFDTYFFNIAPSEAQTMDPQERLFLQTAWRCVEHAGYSRKALRGRAVGVYAGVMYGQYQFFGVESQAQGKQESTDSSYASVANRVSYTFDFHGPSMAVDSMCSSSLSAIHLAIGAIRSGEIEMALAGGVNLNLHRNKYVALSQGKYLAKDGRCRGFGEGGTGYVPGEGVGVVLLKGQNEAETDGDTIHGLILGSSLNHGGKTNGYSVPNPVAQGALIKAALDDAGIEPSSLSYLEAHGTGTSLGDPIEINGLGRALGEAFSEQNRLPIGTVKTNVGHLEAAAGMVALSKVLLQMAHGQLVPSIHAEQLNPNIDFERQPFQVQRELSAWTVAEGSRRRAGISSFGAGGANGHLIVEHYEQAPETEADKPRIYPLSAANPDRLRARVAQLITHLQRTAGKQDWRAHFTEITGVAESHIDAQLPLSEYGLDALAMTRLHEAYPQLAEQDSHTVTPAALEQRQPINAASLAYTLQTGREAMSERLAVVASTVQELQQALSAWMAGQTSTVITANQEPHTLEQEARAQAWVEGGEQAWQDNDGQRKPRRIPLPSYPFAGKRYWLEPTEKEPLIYATAQWLAAPLQGSNPPSGQTLLIGADKALREEMGQDIEGTKNLSDWLAGKTDGQTLSILHVSDLYQLDHEPMAELPPLVWALGKRQVHITYAYRADHPKAQAVTGFAKSVQQEQPNIRWSMLACPAGQAVAERAANLIKEGNARQSGRYRIENGKRQQQHIQEVAPSEEVRLEQGGHWLISGGMGGIGYRVAAMLATRFKAKLSLFGRASLDERRQQQLDQLNELGGETRYYKTNICEEDQVASLIADAEASHGPIYGVIHSAGVRDDASIANKTAAEMARVMAPKVRGTENLDKHSAQQPLRHFVLFGSLTALVGTAGQTDYGYANAYLEAFAAQRQGRVERGERRGKTHCLHWPLWREGGMQVTETNRRLLSQTLGMEPLEHAAGMEAFMRSLSAPQTMIAPLRGDRERLLAALNPTALNPTARRSKPTEQPAKSRIRQLQEMAAKIIKAEPEEMDPETELGAFGYDSISFTQLATDLNDTFGLRETPTLFYQHETLTALARYLSERTEAEQQAPQAAPEEEPIAIVGMAAILPGSEDLWRFWERLYAGDDLISTVPEERWDWREYGTETDWVATRWGGFIPDIRGFDAAFFGITDLEAGLMDPAQRLFLQTAWHALEDAAEAPATVSGKEVGIFAGHTHVPYGRLLRHKQGEPHLTTGLNNAILANRVSAYLNLHGPSENIDTACSSGLVAVYRAMASIRAGECEAALAGAVNILLDPEGSLAAARAGMLSPSGRCRSFDKQADGYVRSEGVGVLYLKPMRAARDDGNPIHALIRGGAVNHGGRANSLTSPNPKAQAALIVKAWNRAGIDPRQVGYIETHGTGTSLGDPIEIDGLKQALETLYQQRGLGRPPAASIRIGSVKTTLGHLEVAAGMAGLYKLIAALKRGSVAGNLHMTEENPYLRLAEGPFRIVTQNSEWPQPEGGPRIGAISAFGFGGSNAHMVLEQNRQPEEKEQDRGSQVVVLSAKTQERLEETARRLQDWLSKNQPTLASLAYSLQVGRDAMRHRMAMRVADTKELAARLAEFDRGEHRRFRQGKAQQKTEDQQEQHTQDDQAAAWEEGKRVDWRATYGNKPPQRISTPGYPFLPTAHWPTPRAEQSKATRITLSGRESWLADHRLNGTVIYPAAAHLAMLHQAAPQQRLRNLVWMRPLWLEEPQTIELEQRNGGFRLYTDNGQDHCEGTLERIERKVRPARLEIAAIAARSNRRREAAEVYRLHAETGIEYGPAYRTITQWQANEREVLAKLSLPAAAGTSPWAMHPSMLDGALQAVYGLGTKAGRGRAYLPFTLGAMQVYEKLGKTAYVHITQGTNEGEMPHYRIEISDESGRVAVVLEELTFRAKAGTEPSAKQELIYGRDWQPHKRERQTHETAAGPLLIIAAGQKEAESVGEAAEVLIPEQEKNSSGQYQKKLTALKQEGRNPQRILIILNPETTTSEQANHRMHHLGQALAEEQEPVRVLILHHNPQQGAIGYSMALTALARTLTAEEKQLTFRVLEERDTEISPTVIAAEWAERWQGVDSHRHQGKRLMRAQYKQLEQTEKAAIRKQGAYLITGGLGGLGQHMARYMTAAGATCVLIGRSPEPASHSWDGTHGRASYIQADITREQDVQAVLDTLQQRNGRLNGIIHNAGHLGDGPFMHKTAAQMEAVLAPKIKGTQILDRLTATQPMDFFILSGTLATEIANPGQSDYAYANGYLEDIAQARRRQEAEGTRQGRTTCISWPYWREGGMHMPRERQEAVFKAYGIAPLPTEIGLEQLRKAMSWPQAVMIPIYGDRERIEQNLRRREKVGEEESEHEQARETKQQNVHKAPVRPTLQSAQEWLSALVAGAIEQPPESIESERSFVEYGIDSFLNIKIIRQLEGYFGTLRKTLLYENKNIEELAAYLEREHKSALVKQLHETEEAKRTAPKVRAKQWLTQQIAEAIEQRPDSIDPTEPFAEYGIDSFLNIKIIRRLEGYFGTLRKTLLFENNNIEQLSAYLEREHKGKLAKMELEEAESEEVALEEESKLDRVKTKQWLTQQIAEAIEQSADSIDPTESFTEYGIDSFLNIKINRQLEGYFGTLRKTLLYEHSNIEQLAAYLEREHGRELAAITDKIDSNQGQQGGVQAKEGSQTKGQVYLRSELSDAQAQRISAISAGNESEAAVSRGTRDIAPWLFEVSHGRAYFHITRSQKILLSYAYTGTAEDYEAGVEEIASYARAQGLQLNIISETPLEGIGDHGIRSTPFGVVQRIRSLGQYSMTGGKKRRLRYLVQKFAALGAVRTEEYRVGSRSETDLAIAGLIEAWSAGKTQVNPLIGRVRQEVLDGRLNGEHRLFITELDGELQNAIMVTSLAGGKTYLMDLEFYGPDMPLGGLEYAITQIMTKLSAEGVETYSLGGTYGPHLGDLGESTQAEPELEALLAELRKRQDFGAGNYQFKNKFRPENKPIYLSRPEGSEAGSVYEVLMMIADPEEEEKK